MNHVFKKIIFALTLTIFTSLVSLPIQANASENTNPSENIPKNTKVENKNALKVFENLKNSKKTKSSLKNITKNIELQNEFEELNYLSVNNENDLEIVYQSENTETGTIIAYNKNSNSYILLEANTKTGDIVLVVNDEEYVLTYEGENIFAYSKLGTKIPVLITEYQTSPSSELESPLFPQEIAKETKTSFGKNYGPFYKTNKTLVTVLGAAGTIGGVIALKINHPLLGTVSTIAGAISWVADQAYATLYVKYYQAYATYDPTYVRQTEYFYNYNNYTSLVKSRVWHFYSSRPY